jgi:hypothetical protein
VTQADLEHLISDSVEESLTLDYKAADSLGKTDGKKREITKDVSAFANSAGGRIIYGIKEYDDPNRRHLPERLDPVNGREFTKEWLEQVIAGIRPRITNIVITPVRLDSGELDVAYVVDVPQATTAHQAADFRYYRRYNFESVPLHDHEIRDINSRSEHPLLEVGFRIVLETVEVRSNPLGPSYRNRTARYESCRLLIAVHNAGTRLARYVSGFIYVPLELIREADLPHRDDQDEIDGVAVGKFTIDNTTRDVVGTDKNPLGPTPIYGPSWYSPIHPGTARRVDQIILDPEAVTHRSELSLSWSVFADSAPERKGSQRVVTIAVDDRR